MNITQKQIDAINKVRKFQDEYNDLLDEIADSGLILRTTADHRNNGMLFEIKALTGQILTNG